jgi:uncharacterized coiled-coil DUF342 family protein
MEDELELLREQINSLKNEIRERDLYIEQLEEELKYTAQALFMMNKELQDLVESQQVSLDRSIPSS